MKKITNFRLYLSDVGEKNSLNKGDSQSIQNVGGND